MKKTAAQLVAEATAEIVTLTPQEALDLQGKGEAVLVDIRDVRELAREGKVPGAVHAPRGMLEFWIDPESPYHRDVFAQTGKTYIFFCAAAWRSALATRDVQNMGFGPVAHIEGGFTAWRDQEMPVETPQSKEG
ncbi:rhodanese-like domain-containing protein [Pseudahrensia aquimaris]|uniref:Rhodanese-like domain-containing protein n=1 Tax=Pseudahrensia aquimaris TaxID=744461 RepID=A0ABW3FLQ7_9HYPH